MAMREDAVAALEAAVVTLSDVSPKRLFGADGHCTRDKVFAMVTKHGEIVFKFDDAELHASMMDAGGEGWSPRGGKAFGRWLMLPTSMQDAETLRVWAAAAQGTV